MSSPPVALVLTLGLFVGGLTASVSDVLSFVAVVTAALTGALRYFVVLRRGSQAQVERATAYGFYLGVAISSVLLLLDRLW